MLTYHFGKTTDLHIVIIKIKISYVLQKHSNVKILRNVILLREGGKPALAWVGFEFRLSYSQWYLVLGLVGLELWLVSGIALNKCLCE